VLAIRDDAAPTALIIERSADDAGLAARELRHRVEKVREAGKTVAQGEPDLSVGCISMPGRNHHTRLGELLDDLRRCHLRRESNERLSAA